MEKAKFSYDRKLIVGVSGGPDSMCLLHLVSQMSYPVVAAHLDHGLRPESGEEAQFVRDFTKGNEIKFELGKQNVGKFAKEKKISIEEAARELRYSFLYKVADKYDAQAVLVAHHADDQVETVLMHLIRGAGLSGLRGMQVITICPEWSKTIPLVRPLLEVWREDIISYNEKNKLLAKHDQSNLDTTYYRNRLRHELIPYLESYNPKIRQILWRMADTLTADHEVLEQEGEKAWQECNTNTNEKWTALHLDTFKSMKLGIQRYLVRRAINVLRPGLRNIDYAAIERVVSFVRSPTKSKQQDVMAGLKVEIINDQLVIMEWEGEWMLPVENIPLISDQYKLSIPGGITIGSGWTVKAEMYQSSDEVRKKIYANSDRYIAWLDASKVGGNMVIRHWEPGDRIKPLGMEGKSIKVSDLFINVKLAKQMRKNWPLVLVRGEVAWIPGYRLAHNFRITENTSSIVRISLRNDGELDSLFYS